MDITRRGFLRGLGALAAGAYLGLGRAIRPIYAPEPEERPGGPGTVRSWAGQGEPNEWSDPDNWTPTGVPVAGEDLAAYRLVRFNSSGNLVYADPKHTRGYRAGRIDARRLTTEN